jgi:hypothetical protein
VNKSNNTDQNNQISHVIPQNVFTYRYVFEFIHKIAGYFPTRLHPNQRENYNKWRLLNPTDSIFYPSNIVNLKLLAGFVGYFVKFKVISLNSDQTY